MFISRLPATTQCNKFIESALYLPCLGGRDYTSKVADKTPLLDIIKAIALAIIFPITLIAVVIRSLNRRHIQIPPAAQSIQTPPPSSPRPQDPARSLEELSPICIALNHSASTINRLSSTDLKKARLSQILRNGKNLLQEVLTHPETAEKYQCLRNITMAMCNARTVQSNFSLGNLNFNPTIDAAFQPILDNIHLIGAIDQSSRQKYNELFIYIAAILDTPDVELRYRGFGALFPILLPIFTELAQDRSYQDETRTLLETRTTRVAHLPTATSDSLRTDPSSPTYAEEKAQLHSYSMEIPIEQLINPPQYLDDSLDRNQMLNQVMRLMFLGGTYGPGELAAGVVDRQFDPFEPEIQFSPGGYTHVTRLGVADAESLRPASRPNTGHDPLVFGGIIHCGRNIPTDASEDHNRGFDFMTGRREIYLSGEVAGSRVDVDQDLMLTPEFFPKIKAATIIALETLISGEPLLIHCSQGKDRSPMFAALIMSLVYDSTIYQAASLIRKRRPIAWPFELGYGTFAEKLWAPILRQDAEIRSLVTQLRSAWQERTIFTESA